MDTVRKSTKMNHSLAVDYFSNEVKEHNNSANVSVFDNWATINSATTTQRLHLSDRDGAS